VETYARSESTLRRTARRYSLCADDAEDALQRALEILLRKAPSDNPRELVKWTQTVVKHEALAVRREREKFLAGPAAVTPDPDGEDWTALLPAPSDGPPERVERREAIARSREALQALKPQELRALTLLAEGYSYVEIGEITGYSQTKVNRCLAEGRERFRKVIAHHEDGSRCVAMKPLLSAFCDGEAKPEQVAELREHLRACGHCRATLRAYRAAPKAAIALAPMLPLDRSVLERLHEALADLGARLGGGSGAAAGQTAVGGGAGGIGAGALAKVAAVCVATAGGAACIATGVAPALPGFGGEHGPVPQAERTHAEALATPQPEKEPFAPESRPKQERPEERSRDRQAPAPAAADPVEYAPPPEPVEYAPPPEPVVEPSPEPAPVVSSGGSPAGEFGP
jgi:RNA polymerase sigma factor (sigma-70 family)